jgi:hypothetical protein
MRVLLGHAHALVGPKLARDLRIGAERLTHVRRQGFRRPAARELGRAPIELDQRALNLLLMRLLR